MLAHFIGFTMIGVLTGAAARVFYTGRDFKQLVGTMTLGVIGALIGGLLSWTNWPSVADDQFHYANLLLALVGGGLAIGFAAGRTYVGQLDEGKPS